MLVILSLSAAGVYFLFEKIWGVGVTNSEPSELYIKTGSSFDDVFRSLDQQGLLKYPQFFSILAKQMNYTDSNVKSGKYTIPEQASNRSLLQLLRSGNQSPINITFNNIMAVGDLASRLCRQVEPDSLSILRVIMNPVNLKNNQLIKESATTIFLPNTYEIYWNTSAQNLYDRMQNEYELFWNSDDRMIKLERVGLSKTEVSILASIVQKESNNDNEKPIIAGLYLNRLKRGMPLQADPTVVFAIGDYSIKRVLNKHLLFDSPYNTYLFSGLPPGPICIPEISSIESVLNVQSHRYLYMCAKPGYEGEHLFATNLIDHNRNARRYQNWLNREGILR